MHDSRRVRLVLGVLLVAALALITVDARNAAAGPLRGLRSFGGTVFGSAENAVGALASPLAGFFATAAGTPASQAKVADLQRQVVRLRAELSQAQLSASDEAQLQHLLQLAGRGGYRVVAARVVAVGQGYAHTVTVDAGTADGIKARETVLNGAGLVGTVTSVSTHTASVTLVTDGSATVGVRVAGTGQLGVVSGGGQNGTDPAQLRLQLFNASAVLHAGQRLVTFGSVGGRPYVPGVPVGVITQVTNGGNSLTKLAIVRPFADVGALGVVGVVIAPPRTNPRDSVLPPSPSPQPSVSGTPSPGATSSPSPSATPTGAGQPTGG